LVGISKTRRAIAAAVLCVLAAWAWRLLAGESAADAALGGNGWEPLSIYDTPPTAAGGSRRLTTGRRTGTPPMLR
jgi:hypothetical protein